LNTSILSYFYADQPFSDIIITNTQILGVPTELNTSTFHIGCKEKFIEILGFSYVTKE